MTVKSSIVILALSLFSQLDSSYRVCLSLNQLFAMVRHGCFSTSPTHLPSSLASTVLQFHIEAELMSFFLCALFTVFAISLGPTPFCHNKHLASRACILPAA